jgi:hypothetical protein
VGLLNLLNKIVHTRPDIPLPTDLPNKIFMQCLFALGDSLKEIKCKSVESRAAAFNLLLTLCRRNE